MFRNVSIAPGLADEFMLGSKKLRPRLADQSVEHHEQQSTESRFRRVSTQVDTSNGLVARSAMIFAVRGARVTHHNPPHGLNRLPLARATQDWYEMN